MPLRRFAECMSEDLFHFNILLIPFAFVCGVLWHNVYGPLSLLLMLPLVPLHYFLRLCIDKLSVFLIAVWSTVIYGALALFIPALSGLKAIVYIVFCAFMCSYCVRRRTSVESKLTINFEGLCFPLVLLAAEYIAVSRIGLDYMKEFIYIQASLLLINALVYVHISGINSELELASSESLQSTKFISRFAGKFMLVYLVGLSAVLFLFRYVPFGYLTKALGNAIIAVLRYLFSFLSSDSKEVVEQAASGGGKDGLLALGGSTPPVWMQILEQILVYTINIFALVVLVALIVLFCLKLYKGFYNMHDGSIQGFDGESKVTKLKSTSSTHKLFGVNIKNPTRRKYFKRVNKYMKKHKVSVANTPCEIEETLRSVDNLGDITVDYEKVRYGKNEF